MPETEYQAFAEWLKKVDKALNKLCGMSHRDLADQNWRDWFDSDMTPEEAAAECLANEGMEELLGGD